MAAVVLSDFSSGAGDIQREQRRKKEGGSARTEDEG
jgi:hypothetical protein